MEKQEKLKTKTVICWNCKTAWIIPENVVDDIKELFTETDTEKFWIRFCPVCPEFERFAEFFEDQPILPPED